MGDQWNIARVKGSSFPPKDPSESIAFREGGIWAGTAVDRKSLDPSKSLSGQAGTFQPPMRGKVVLRHDKKEHWPEIFDTGKKYRRSCAATRMTLPLWRRDIAADPSLLDGPETYEGDAELNRAKETVVVNRKKRGSSSESESAPKGKAKGKGPAADFGWPQGHFAADGVWEAPPESERGTHRSRSPCASGSVGPA